jgi:hypothetical protein
MSFIQLLLKTPNKREGAYIINILLFLKGLKFAFAGAAIRANPLVGQILKGGPRLNAVVGVALGRVINISAHYALVFFHTTVSTKPVF